MSGFKQFAVDKIWVITGAASGIGREMVRRIAKHRGVVWALDLDQAALDSLQLEAKRESWDIYTQVLDVTDEDAVTKVLEHIKHTSRRIDVWINSAGLQKIGPFSVMSRRDFDKVMNVNFLSVIQISRRLMEIMENQGGGVLLNMASVAGHVPSPFMTAYVASKHGVVGFTRALQAEFEMTKAPMRAAFASPGFVNTPIIDRGSDQGFPEWLSWMLTNAESCAKEILDALAAGQNEIYPTWSGTMMRAAYSLMPKTTVRSSKVLLTKGFKDLLLNRFQVPR